MTVTKAIPTAEKVPVTAFVDWNAQICEFRLENGLDESREPDSSDVLDHVFGKLRKLLSGHRQERLNGKQVQRRFEIHLRLYHGWHEERRQTPRRQNLGRIGIEDLSNLSSDNWVSVRSLNFGDYALKALDKRIETTTGVHFPATYRSQGTSKIYNEKMVDTALVADLVVSAVQTDEPSWLIVVGTDIDLMPGVYAAESYMHGTGRKLAFIKRGDAWLRCNDLHELKEA